MTNVHLDHVSKDFGHHRVLDDISLDIAEGEFVVLLGASGSGKSTTLRLIAGLERVSAGTITFGDRTVSTPRTTVPPNKRSLGFVFQNYALWPHLTVRHNVEYPLRARRRTQGRNGSQIRQDALRALDLVHLGDLADRRISQLSGGQQQRVALARAVVSDPTLVLFDEPLSNLDAQLRTELRGEIKRLHDELGFTAVYVTHDHNEAIALADRIAVFESSHISQYGSAHQVFAQPSTESVGRFLGFENLLPVIVTERLGGGPIRYRVVVSATGTAVVTTGPADLQVGDAALVCLRARDVTIQPLKHDPATRSSDTVLDARVSDVTHLDTGYTARLTLRDTQLIGVLSVQDWGADPKELLTTDRWRAGALIDWSRAHLVRTPGPSARSGQDPDPVDRSALTPQLSPAAQGDRS